MERMLKAGLTLVTAAAILVPLAAAAQGAVFTIPETELLSDSEFGVKAWGPGTVAGRADGPGASVDFALTGLGSSGTGVKDNYPVDTVYGQVLPSHGNGDFSIFTGYGLRVENLDDGGVWFQLCMNTGFTGASGTPSSDLTNDTYWTSSPGWTYVGPGEEVLIILDFDGAVAYNITDNKVPHTGGGLSWPNGGVYAINAFDRAEVSAVGFEIADFSGANPAVTVRLTPVASDAGVGTGGAGDGAMVAGVIQAYPNPGRAVTIQVAADAGRRLGAGPAALVVYDVEGRVVCSLWAGTLADGPAGRACGAGVDVGGLKIAWDGGNAGGARCAPGLYFVCLDGSCGRCTRPLLLTR